MSAAPQQPALLPLKKGIVKQVLSGDSVIIRGQPKNGPPAEKQINFSNVIAPKLARRPTNPTEEGAKDEPWAWEAREFLRQMLVGEEVYFQCERKPNATRDYGVIFLGKDPNNLTNITELAVSEGLIQVRRENVRTNNPELQRLIELEDQAKAQGKGRYGTTAPVVRSIVWQIENPRHFVDLQAGKPVRAIIEHVRDGSTVRAFLLPGFQYVTLMISGIRCPGFRLDSDGRPDPSVVVPFAEEARFFVESRLLQRDVEIVLESNNNSNFVGTILFPKGNIAEALLREGFAKCVDWSMAFMKTGVDKLRAAERHAKTNRVRLWKDYTPPTAQFSGKEKDFTGTVIEVHNGDAITVKVNNNQVKKVFLSSIRPPREAAKVIDEADAKPAPPATNKSGRPLYDVPWLFEAREFLRKKLVGKSVKCTLDYVSPARDNFPEKFCYTVTVGGSNVAEALVSRGLAQVIRYRQDDDQRSSKYDDLMAAETQASKQQKGIFAKKDIPVHRINDLTTAPDSSRVKHQYLPSWQRALRTEAVVEFVASGSRFRLFIPKESCLVTFLLAGISCPRSSRPSADGKESNPGEPYGDEAYNFVKERILQRDVSVHVDTVDKAGTSVIGWLWLENNVNLSVALVEEGLATVHFTAEKSEHYRVLKAAEDQAKAQKKNIWKNWVEPVAEETKAHDNDDDVNDKVEEKAPAERKMKLEEIVVTEVTPDFHFFAQTTDNGPKLEQLMSKLRQDFKSTPPVSGSYTPRRDDLCAAKFSEDEEWYRARVLKVDKTQATIKYIDYGNTETVPITRLAVLPPAFTSDSAYATEYALAWAVLPPDEEDKLEAYKTFAQDVLNRTLNLNVEFVNNGLPNATLFDPKTKADIGRGLVQDGFIIVEKRPGRRFAKIVNEYKDLEQQARKSHIGIWKYGDITEDNAVEFG